MQAFAVERGGAASPESVSAGIGSADVPPRAWPGPPLPGWAWYALLAGGYLALAQLGYRLLDESGVAVWWPPAGLYLAALVLLPRRRWPLAALAVFPAAVLGSLLHGRPPAVAAWYYVGNTLEAMAGAALVLRAAGPRPRPSTVRGAFALVALPAVAGAAISLAQHALRALAGGEGISLRTWAFWGGSSLGVLVVAPLLLAFAEPRPIRLPRGWRAAEAAALSAALAASLLLATASREAVPWAHAIVIVLPLLWAALRFRVRGATLALAGVAVAMVRLDVAGGPTTREQFLLAVVVLAVLLVAAAADERRDAALELARSRDLLGAFFARSPTGMFIQDERLRLVVHSPRFERVFGLPAGELLGRTPEELLPGPEGRAVAAAEREVLASETALEREVTVRGRTYLSALFPIPRPEAPSYLGGFAVDVTDRVRAVAALRASEERLRLVEAAVDQSADALAVVDEDARYVWVNRAAARFFGREKGEVVGRTVSELDPGADPGAWRERLEATAAHGIRVEEQPLRAADGRTFPAEVATALVQFGGRRYFVLSTRDVSDRRRAEESARLAALGTLAAGVAHEINNPLAYVVSNLGWLREQLAGGAPVAGDELRQVVDEARDGALRVRDVVQQLRLFARPDESPGRVDVRAAARAAMAVAANELRSRAAIVTRFADDVPPVLGNENRVAQVFLNLLTNAAQAIPEGRADREAIRVEIRREGASVVAEVSDTGAGMTPEVRTHVFEPFFTTRPFGAGTGLGLYICHEIVTRMGGRIEVESVPGAGSTFRVVLPASEAVPRAPEAEGDGAPAGRRARILVLDDDERVAGALGRVLGRDHDVEVATEPRAALERVRGGAAWDVVFCDLMMPGMTGMEWYEEVRALSPDLARRVVFVTGGAFTDAARSFLERVPNLHLEKPFAPAEVRAVVARFAA